MKTCYIFGAAEGLPKCFEKRKDDLVIAADGGLRHLEAIGVLPDITLGDFDSLGEEPSLGEIIRLPVMKDDTDTLKAVKTGFDRGYRRFVLYGCTGKRLDHTLANLQTLSFIAQMGGRGYLCGDGFTATAVKNGALYFNEKAKGNISVFSAETKSLGVSIKGLLYPLENAELDFAFPLGVSNEFSGKAAEVRVLNGTLTVIWSGDMTDLCENKG